MAACAMAMTTGLAGPPDILRIGVAGHAFDHLGNINNQAEAAAASGADIIYSSGLGALGYNGLPADADLEKARKDTHDYITRAKAQGIQLAIGYICASSIVGLESFDQKWTLKFRAQFRAAPGQWRQEDRQGNPLPSWYGGKYEPACMNNPDWRVYEKNMVRLQLQAGYDGIFFDNPTVHPEGCYCPYCMKKFGAFLAASHPAAPHPENDSVESLRELAANRPREFMQFRSGIARDFLTEMRTYARSIKHGAFVTCNNSLNSPEALFSQCRRFAYNINELSQAEDWVTVEDMVSQPRLLANGQTVEYGPTYKQLHAISHDKPVVAVTLADGDYQTPPNLVRLAMAEAAANGASYLSWPAWPENLREKMETAIRPEADFLRRNQKLLNNSPPRSDVVLLLSFHRWIDTENCRMSTVAAALARANIQFTVASESGLEAMLKTFSRKKPVLIIERFTDLKEDEKRVVTCYQKSGGRVVQADGPDWLNKLAIDHPAITLVGPPTIRGVVADQRNSITVHLYNLSIERLSSIEDKVHPAHNIRVALRVLSPRVLSVRALTADDEATNGSLEYTVDPGENDAVVKFTVPRVDIATIVVIHSSWEHGR
jgi:hypothetical protein